MRNYSRMPKKMIGGVPFEQLYPRWEDILDFIEIAVKRQITPDQSGQPKTPRSYMADPDRFKQFFINLVQQSPQLNIKRENVDDTWYEAYNEFFGFGLVRPYLEDPDIEDLFLDSHDKMLMLKNGQKVPVESPFDTPKDVLQWMQGVARKIGKEIHDNEPVVNGSLEDGSRFIFLSRPIVEEPVFVIRKHKVERFDKDLYLASGVAPIEFVKELQQMVEKRKNILVCGATGSGKTTLFNFMGLMIPPEDRTLIIEDTPELQINHEKALKMATTARDARVKSVNDDFAITMQDAVKHALRMKPDRIFIGEVRGPEAFNMLDAMNTGHDGCISTIHANSPSEAVLRLENLALPANPNMIIESLRDMIGSTLDIIIQMKQVPNSSKRVIVEVSQIIHPSQIAVDDKEALKHPTRVSREGHVYLRPIWLWNNQTHCLEKQADMVKTHGEYF